MSEFMQKAPGSLESVSEQNNLPMEEVFMGVEHIILFDSSASMDVSDAEGNTTRFSVAKAELIALQQELEGKIALICFSNQTVFCPSGIPFKPQGGTNLLDALKFIESADDTDIKFHLISDGEPYSENPCISFASNFKTPINCIFIGSKSDAYGGMSFLNKLAKITGGKAVNSSTEGSFKKEFLQLTEGVKQ